MHLLILFSLSAVMAALAIWTSRLPQPARRALLLAVGTGFALRAVVWAVLQLTGAWQIGDTVAVNPDELAVHDAAIRLLGADLAEIEVVAGTLHVAWVIVAWALYEVIGPSLTALQWLNVVLGVALIVATHITAHRFFDERVALGSAWLIALFPPAIAWSVFTLRETFIGLLILAMLVSGRELLTATASRERTLAAAAVLVSAAIALAYTRSYMAFAVMGVLGIAAVTASVKQRSWRPTVGYGLSAVGTLAILLLLPLGSDIITLMYRLVVEPDQDSVLNPLSRVDPARFRDSEDKVASTVASVRSVGIVRASLDATLGGRPQWRPDEFYLLVQPGVFLRWVLIPFVGVGLWHQGRRNVWEATIFGAYLAAMVVFMALTGASVRHQFMLEAVAVVPAVHGIVLVRTDPACHRLVLVAAGLAAAAAAGSVVESLI